MLCCIRRHNDMIEAMKPFGKNFGEIASAQLVAQFGFFHEKQVVNRGDATAPHLRGKITGHAVKGMDKTGEKLDRGKVNITPQIDQKRAGYMEVLQLHTGIFQKSKVWNRMTVRV